MITGSLTLSVLRSMLQSTKLIARGMYDQQAYCRYSEPYSITAGDLEKTLIIPSDAKNPARQKTRLAIVAQVSAMPSVLCIAFLSPVPQY